MLSKIAEKNSTKLIKFHLEKTGNEPTETRTKNSRNPKK